MSIQTNDPRLTAYVLDELTEAERSEVETEIAASPRLQEFVDETRRAVELLSQHLEDEPCPQLTVRQHEELVRETNEACGEPPAVRVETAPSSRRSVPWRRVAACGVLAASLLVGFGLIWTVGVGGSRTPRSVAHTDRPGKTADAYRSVASAVRSPDASRPNHVPVTPRSPVTFTESHPTAEVGKSIRLPTKAGNARLIVAESRAAPPTTPLTKVTRLGMSYDANRVQLAVDRLHLDAPPAADRRIRLWDISSLETNTEGGTSGPATAPAVEQARPDEGMGPGWSGDRYDSIEDNPFREVRNAPLSTFSIDVDTASYAKVRMYLTQHHMLPPPAAVRIEELINYFPYHYPPPEDGRPFAAHVEVAACPWQGDHRLVRVGIQGRVIERAQRPSSNLVFLLDVSGSMDRPNKLPLLKRAMKRLVDELGENDRVAIVVYAGAAGMILPSTTGDRKQTIVDALDQLHAGGSTNGGQGVRLAYQTALDHYIAGGTNRVLLCTDGDFNVGTTSNAELVDLVAGSAKDGVFLSVLGFGMGNHNDAMLEMISNRGNGNYAFIDSDIEAQKVLVEQLSGTLVTIAKDVKIQVEFNPVQVAAYRLIGYENRVLAAEDFNDDKKDAGEIGAGHSVTALYEIVPASSESDVTIPAVDDLKYQQRPTPSDTAANGELLTVKMRYKEPDGDTSTRISFSVVDSGKGFGQASEDFRFAAAVASFGMLLRNSPSQGNTSYDAVLEIASAAAEPGDGYRQEFLQLVASARDLSSP